MKSAFVPWDQMIWVAIAGALATVTLPGMVTSVWHLRWGAYGEALRTVDAASDRAALIFHRVKALLTAVTWLLQRFLVGAALLSIIGLWLYSHLYPDSLGICKQLPLSFGAKPTIRDCQPYASTDFIVPFGVVAFAVLLLSSASELELTIPGLGTIKKTAREGKRAAEVLKEEAPSLEERGEKFLEALPPTE